jgi:hypothetical protein
MKNLLSVDSSEDSIQARTEQAQTHIGDQALFHQTAQKLCRKIGHWPLSVADLEVGT